MAGRYNPRSRHAPITFSKFTDHYVPEALKTTPGFPNLFPRAKTERWRRQMGRFTNQPRGPLQWPSTNGQFDPLSIAAVLDCILRIEPGPYFTGGSLSVALNQHYEQIVWDAITVGKILSDIHSIAVDLSMPTKEQERPIYRRNLTGARQYVVHDDPHGWQWLGLLRDFMGQKAEEMVRDNDRTRSYDLWIPTLAFKYGQKVGE